MYNFVVYIGFVCPIVFLNFDYLTSEKKHRKQSAFEHSKHLISSVLFDHQKIQSVKEIMQNYSRYQNILSSDFFFNVLCFSSTFIVPV